uniref:Uncharacterized protein n=1 Tax=Anguilla anguilla TaxID=7936 RepID=A0A0E9UPW2_ANGAN
MLRELIGQSSGDWVRSTLHRVRSRTEQGA